MPAQPAEAQTALDTVKTIDAATPASVPTNSASTTMSSSGCMHRRSAAPIVLRRFLEPSDSRLWRLLGLLRQEQVEPDLHRRPPVAIDEPRVFVGSKRFCCVGDERRA